MRVTCFLSCSILLLVSLTASPMHTAAQAAGEPSALDRALVAYEQGRLVEARQWFLTAHEESPSARTLRGLGVVSFALGDYIEAIAYLEAALRHPVRPLTEELAALVTQLLERAKAQVARVQIDGDDEELEVRLDDRSTRLDDTHGTYVLPGAHRVTVHRGDVVVLDESRDFVGGSAERFVIAPLPAPALIPPVQALEDDPAPHPIAGATEQPHRRATLATTIAGATTLATGATLYLMAWRRHEAVADECRDGCTRERVDALYDARHIDALGRSGIALCALGVAATVTGVVLHYTLGRREEPRGTLVIGPTAVSWQRRF